MTEPITIKEIQQEYFINLKLHMETSWVRFMEFRTDDNKVYGARLRWDENYGYEIFWVDEPPKDLKDMADRPEFEYVLDSYTNDELGDVVYPNNSVGLARQKEKQ
jgi:hypothetical protein